MSEKGKLYLQQSCEEENTVYLCEEGSDMRTIFKDGKESGVYDSKLDKVLD